MADRPAKMGVQLVLARLLPFLSTSSLLARGRSGDRFSINQQIVKLKLGISISNERDRVKIWVKLKKV
jgi:hypothetical protein